MAIQFIPIDRDTPYIFPPCVQDYLPEDHLARFVGEIVEGLDLNHLSAVYSGKGSKPYHPAMLVTLLFYGLQPAYSLAASWKRRPMTPLPFAI